MHHVVFLLAGLFLVQTGWLKEAQKVTLQSTRFAVLTLILLPLSPADAFNPSGLGVGAPLRELRYTAGSPMKAVARQGGRMPRTNRTAKVSSDGSKHWRKSAFSILEDHHLERPGLQIVGPRKVRRGRTTPSDDSLLRQLKAAEERHRQLKEVVRRLENAASASWCHEKLKLLKRKKLREKDRMTVLATAIHRRLKVPRWELGSGSFGRVLLGRAHDGKLVAIKVNVATSASTSAGMLSTEAAVLQKLTDRRESGFPRLLHYGRQELTLEGQSNPAEILVMDLLGPSIEDLLWECACGTCLSAGCVARLAVQMLDTLQRLHATGWVHNDIKPSNFLMGLPGPERRCDCVHLVDMGLCTPIERSSRLPSALSTGTLLFASRANHRKRSTLPEDDVESLCYCLAFLLTGKLPWSAAEDENAAVVGKETLADKAMDFSHHFSEGLGEEASAVASRIAALWREQERQRLCQPDLQGETDMYAYTSVWPAACRQALLGPSSIDGPEQHPDELTKAAFDWEVAGITWTLEGDIQNPAMI